MRNQYQVIAMNEREKLAAELVTLSEKISALSDILRQDPKDTISSEIEDFTWNSADAIAELAVLRQKILEELDRPIVAAMPSILELRPAESQNRKYQLDSTIAIITEKFTEAFGDT